MRKVTIQTVADHADVSIKTVSRVINNEVSVRDSTRDRVLKIIEKLGYNPSPAAQALAGSQSKIIGLIYDNPSAGYVMANQIGALKACNAEGYNLVIHPCDHEYGDLTNELINIVKKSRLDGLILTPPICDKQELIKELINNNINIATIAPTEKVDGVSSVSCNDVNVVEDAIKLLIKKGHTRIGFIKGHHNHGATEERFIGYQKALRDANIELRNELVKQGDFSFELGKERGKELLEQVNRPTAIFASNDYMAAGVLSIANELGIDVPNDLSIVGFDNAPVSRQIYPSLTTIAQPVEKMAEAATKLLIAKCQKSDTQAEHLVFKAELLIRKSHRVNLRK